MRNTYVDIHEVDEPQEFINVLDMFRRVYGLPAPVDEKKILLYIRRFGYKHVKYALTRLGDEHIREEERRRPYQHFERAIANFTNKYNEKVFAKYSKAS